MAAWLGEGSGGEWIHVYMCMVESLRCSPETITTLLTSYTPIQNKKFLKRQCAVYQLEYTHSSLILSSFLAPVLTAPWLMSQAVMESGPQWGFNHTRRVMLCCRPLAWVASTLSSVYGVLPSWQLSPVPEGFSGTPAQGRLHPSFWMSGHLDINPVFAAQSLCGPPH